MLKREYLRRLPLAIGIGGAILLTVGIGIFVLALILAIWGAVGVGYVLLKVALTFALVGVPVAIAGFAIDGGTNGR